MKENGVYQMKCMDCPLKYIGRRAKYFILDKSTFNQLGIIMVTQDIKITY
jgi:hypothetical protein